MLASQISSQVGIKEAKHQLTWNKRHVTGKQFCPFLFISFLSDVTYNNKKITFLPNSKIFLSY